MDSNQTQTANVFMAPTARDEARNAVVNSIESTFGAMKRYAETLNKDFEHLPFKWYTVAARDKRDAAKPILVEKTTLFDALKARNHSNPSTIWARVCKYGMALDNPEADESADEPKARGTKAPPRDVFTRNTEELIALYKFNQSQTYLPGDVAEAHTYIKTALEALGVDLSTIE